MVLKVSSTDPHTSNSNLHTSQKSSSQASSSTQSSIGKVGQGVLQNVKSYYSSAKTKVNTKLAVTGVNFLYQTVKKNDEDFLIKLTGSDVSLILKQIAPQLPIALQKLLEDGFAKQFSQNQTVATEKLGEIVMVHIVSNLAAYYYPEAAKEFRENKPIQQPVPLTEFLRKVTEEMMSLFADELDAVDATVANGAAITPELFDSLSQKLLHRILPQNSSGLTNVAISLEKTLIQRCDLKALISKGLMELYKPFGDWLSGGDFVLEQSDIYQDFIPILENLGACTADCMAKHNTKTDSALLQKLTGVNDVHELIKILSPKLLNGLLDNEKVKKALTDLSFDALGILERNKNTATDVCSSIILKLVANISKEVFAEDIKKNNEVPVDDFIVRVCMGVSDIFGTHLQKIKQLPSNQPLSADLFLPLAEHLLTILAPKNPSVLSFIQRRKVRLTEKLCSIIQEFYESIALREDKKVYKQILREILYNPEELENPTDEPLPLIPTKELAKYYGIESIVKQLYNACYNITDIGRGFVADKFSDPAVVIDQMQETFKDTIPKHLQKSIAGGVSKLIQLNHKITDNKIIYDHLRAKFPTSTFPDILLDEIAKYVLVLIQSGKKIDTSKVLFEHIRKNKIAITDDNILLLSEEIFAFINPANPLHWLTPAVQNILHLTLFKGLVHLLEKVDRKNRTPFENLFPAALQILLDVSAQELPVIIAGIKNIANPDHELLMQPFVDKLIHLFFEDDDPNGAVLDDHLPIPDEFKPFVSDLIRRNAHKILLPMIEACTSWIDAKETNRARLNAVYGNSHASEACKVVGAFVAHSIPYQLQEQHEGFADEIMDNASHLLASKDGKIPSKKKRDQLKQMIDFTMESLAHNNTAPMKDLLSFIQNFSEAALLRCFADVSECLDTLDQDSKNNPNGTMLVQGTTILLKELKDHLTLIAEVKEKLKQYKAGKIPLDVMMQKFDEAGKLHPALADGTFQQRELFFQTFAKKLLKIVGVDKNAKLPIPQFLKSPVWKVFKGQLMPRILLKLFEKFKNPYSQSLILISFFEQINANMDKVDVSKTDDDFPKYTDAPQETIEEILKGVISALGLMQPSTITRFAIKKKKIVDSAAQAMGQPLRDILQEKSLKEIFDDLIVSLLPHLHHGNWDDQSGTFIRVKNKTQTVITDFDFAHILPRTKAEQKEYDKTQKKEERLAKEKMVKEITRTIENQTQYIFLGIFRKLWQKFRRFVELIIEKTSGKSAEKIKQKVNHFLDGAAHYFIKPTLVLSTYPILIAAKKLLRFYFVNKSTAFTNDVYHGIHPNIFFFVIEKILAFIGDAQSSQDITEHSSSGVSLNSSLSTT